MKNEIIKPIPGFEGYFATSCGRILSKKGNHGTSPIKPIFQAINIKTGYKQVILWIKPKKPISKTVHRLIATTFLPTPSIDQKIIRHLDGIKTNNHVSNLSWGTHKENSQDTIRHGRSTFGSRNPASILDEEMVRNIKHKIKNKEKLTAIAKSFGVSRRTIANIRSGFSWKHVLMPEE